MPLFERRGRFYHIGGRRLIRVTSVLDVLNKPQLIPWAAKSAAEVALSEPTMSVEQVVAQVFSKKEKAADIGSEVHRIIQLINSGKEVALESVPPEKEGYIKAFLSFCKFTSPTTLCSEQECYSAIHGYAGTTDWIVKLPNGSIWLLDFKTGGIYLEASLQLCAYKNAIHEMIDTGILTIPKIDTTAVIQLCADGTFNLRPYDAPFEVFLSVLKIFNWYEQNK